MFKAQCSFERISEFENGTADFCIGIKLQEHIRHTVVVVTILISVFIGRDDLEAIRKMFFQKFQEQEQNYIIIILSLYYCRVRKCQQPFSHKIHLYVHKTKSLYLKNKITLPENKRYSS